MTATARAPRVMFYVQHLLGVGHIARASRIAAALAADGFDVTVVSGGTEVPGFPGPGIAHVALPPVRVSDEGFRGLYRPDGTPVDDAFKAHRRDLLLAAFRDIRPDILMTEAFPFGRRQMRFELLPLLEAAKARPSPPTIVASVRDILQENTKPGRDQEYADLARAFFDAVLVHGDPAFARFEDSFPLAAQVMDLVRYTGLVAAPLPPPSPDRFDVVVSAGGGAVGTGVLRATLGAARGLPDLGSWCMIAGVNLPDAVYRELGADLPAHVRLVRFRQDFVGLLRRARLSVSQAGYNTVCDILSAGCRSVLVPFTQGGETEQAARARRLAGLGRAAVLAEQDLSAGTMRAAIDTALAGPDPDPAAFDLGGAQATARILRSLLR